MLYDTYVILTKVPQRIYFSRAEQSLTTQLNKRIFSNQTQLSIKGRKENSSNSSGTMVKVSKESSVASAVLLMR